MSADNAIRGIANRLREDPNALKLAEADIANRLEQAADQIDEATATFRTQRDGWREIGEVLIKAAYGFEMRGFGDTPPIELLEPIRGVAGMALPGHEGETGGKSVDELAVGALRDSLIGRTWHVGGHKGFNTCDYPLCEFRGKGIPLQTVDVRGPKPQGGEQEQKGTKIHVCSHPTAKEPGECQQWAQYVAARARAGRIRIS